MRFIDTNIIIRFLTDDVPEKADACEEVFKREARKEERVFITDLVVAEIVWVLESVYGLSKKEIQDKVEKILNTPNLFCLHKDIILGALILCAEKDIDFIDAYNALTLKEKGIKELYSYDRHYEQIEWLTRLEP